MNTGAYLVLARLLFNEVPAKSKGTLLTYRNNFVPASEPLLAGNEQPAFHQARLNGLGSQHTLLHYAVSSPSGHTQGIPESPRPVFPVIQQRPLFSPLTKLISRTSFQFKGTGWYVTDYARKPESTPKSEAKPEAESKTAAESKTGAESKPGAESSGSSTESGNGRKSSDAGPKGQKTPSSPNR